MKIIPINCRYNSNLVQNKRTQNGCGHRVQNSFVSFYGLKKSQFSNFDLFLIEAYKLPIETYKSKDEYNAKITLLLDKIDSRPLIGRVPETVKLRKDIMADWYEYFKSTKDKHSCATKIVVLDSLTKNLNVKNDNLPPVFNLNVFENAIHQIQNEFARTPKYKFDFSKVYKNNLKVFYEKNTIRLPNKTGWVVIPSLSNDPKHFKNNVNALKTLSHRNWCTKNSAAEPYLTQGDFHIYFDENKPLLGLRFVGNSVREIQGADNDNKIPLNVLDVFNEYLLKNGFATKLSALKSIKQANEAQQALNKAKILLKDDIKSNNYSAILNYFGINSKVSPNGLLTISHYNQPNLFKFSDLGIDENKMFKSIEKIEKNAIFSFSNLSDLGKLTHIGGDAIFSDSKLTSLCNLKNVSGMAKFSNSDIIDLGDLEYIGGNAIFSDSMCKDLFKLREIGGNADFRGSNVETLSNLAFIRGDAIFLNSTLKDIANLQLIGGNADFSGCHLKNLGKLSKINGNAYFTLSSIESLSNLESIGEEADFTNATIKDFGFLKHIGGSVDFSCASINSLNLLEFIGGDASFLRSKIFDLGELKSILGNVDFRYSKLKSLGKLSFIGGQARFNGADINDYERLNHK